MKGDGTVVGRGVGTIGEFKFIELKNLDFECEGSRKPHALRA